MFLSIQVSHHAHLYLHEKNLSQNLSPDLRLAHVSSLQDEAYHAWMSLSSFALPVHHAPSLTQNDESQARTSSIKHTFHTYTFVSG